MGRYPHACVYEVHVTILNIASGYLCMVSSNCTPRETEAAPGQRLSYKVRTQYTMAKGNASEKKEVKKPKKDKKGKK